MQKKQSKPKIHLEKEAEAHIKIGKLLQKERSPEKQKEVQKIVKSGRPLFAKIRAIEKLDEELTMNDIQKAEPQKSGTDPEPSRNRRRLKSPIASAKFFHFLFFELSKILKFGKKSHTITTGFLPFMIHLDRDIHKSFRDHLQKQYLVPLIKILKHVMEAGWLILNKREYNLLVVMDQLCRELFAMDFNLLNFKKRDNLEKLKKIESLFLIMHYRHDYMEMTIECINKVIKADNLLKTEAKNVGIMVRRILTEDLILPSVYNFILAVNIVKYRKFLTLKDLINYQAGHVLSTSYYDCTEKVQEKINDYINELDKNLQPVVDRRDAIIRLKAFLPPGQDKDPNFKLLEYFYDDKKSNPPLNLTKDSENAIYLSINLASRYLTLVQDILNGQININGSGIAEIFTRRFFSLDFNKLQHYADNLQKLSYSLTHMPLSRYYQLKEVPRGALGIEIEVLKTINDICTQITEIGQKLSEVIINRKENIQSTANNSIDLNAISGKLYSIPYEKSQVLTNNILHGRTVIDALSFITCLSYEIVIFYRDRNIMDLLKNEDRVKKTISSQIEIITRIGDNETCQRIKKKYKI